MPRVLAIDYGMKRVGLAISDPTKLIANELETLSPNLIIEFIKKNKLIWELDTIVLGYPKDLQNRDTHLTSEVEIFNGKLKKTFPDIQIKLVDERFTSSIARQTLYTMGLSKTKRQEKQRIDKISALILLQNFLDYPYIHGSPLLIKNK